MTPKGECVDIGGLMARLRLPYTDIQKLLAEARQHPDDNDRFPLPINHEGRNYWSLADIKRYLARPVGITQILRKEELPCTTLEQNY
jgi:hypothetical protein